MRVVFDLDGVLFDTRSAVREAYLRAGVEMPTDAWGKPWQEWLVPMYDTRMQAHAVHVAKTQHYSNMIKREEIRSLPALRLLLALQDRSIAQVGILTGASRAAVEDLLTYGTGRVGFRLYGTSKSRHEKIDVLRSLESGVYIDDMPFPEVDGWRIVRHEGERETLNDLMEKLWMP